MSVALTYIQDSVHAACVTECTKLHWRVRPSPPPLHMNSAFIRSRRRCRLQVSLKCLPSMAARRVDARSSLCFKSDDTLQFALCLLITL